jgi:hypothetical protein
MSHANEVFRRAREGIEAGEGVVARPPRTTFVPANPEPKITVLPPHETIMQVQHPAQQQVVVTTSAVDRSKGFQIAITPISVVVGILAVVVSLAFKSELLSFTSILVFWATFAAVYVVGWALTALATPEAVSFYSAKRQWDVIEREQVERWNHYKWQTGRSPQLPVRTTLSVCETDERSAKLIRPNCNRQSRLAAPRTQLQQDIRLATIIGLAVGLPLALAVLALGGQP